MNKVFNKIKKVIKNAKDERDKVAIAKALEFTKGNHKYVALLMDIDSDDVVVAYKNHYIATRLVSKFMKLKKNVVKNILFGKMEDKETFKNVNFIKDVVGEFLWQMNEHNKYHEEYESGNKKETFQEFMNKKRASRSDINKNNKDKDVKRN